MRRKKTMAKIFQKIIKSPFITASHCLALFAPSAFILSTISS
jgi:hypothetical protein